eukprot:SAG11_NODE_31717_length_289_cov_2.136842_1_plen_62_part_10
MITLVGASSGDANHSKSAFSRDLLGRPTASIIERGRSNFHVHIYVYPRIMNVVYIYRGGNHT